MFINCDDVNLETTKTFASKILRKIRKLYVGKPFKLKYTWAMDLNAIWESDKHFVIPYYCYNEKGLGYKVFLRLPKREPIVGTLYGDDIYGNKHVLAVNVFPATFHDPSCVIKMIQMVAKVPIEYGREQLAFNFKISNEGGDAI